MYFVEDASYPGRKNVKTGTTSRDFLVVKKAFPACKKNDAIFPFIEPFKYSLIFRAGFYFVSPVVFLIQLHGTNWWELSRHRCTVALESPVVNCLIHLPLKLPKRNVPQKENNLSLLQPDIEFCSTSSWDFIVSQSTDSTAWSTKQIFLSPLSSLVITKHLVSVIPYEVVKFQTDYRWSKIGWHFRYNLDNLHISLEGNTPKGLGSRSIGSREKL